MGAWELAAVVDNPLNFVRKILFAAAVYHQGVEILRLLLAGIVVGAEIGDFESGIEDSAVAAGYPEILFALGTESPAGLVPIVQP